MKKLNRFISLSLATVMALGMFGGTASAVNADGVTEDSEIHYDVPAYVTYQTGQTAPDAKFVVTMEAVASDDLSKYTVTDDENKPLELKTVSGFTPVTNDYDFTADGLDADDDNTIVHRGESPYFARIKQDFSLEDAEVTAPGLYAFKLSQTEGTPVPKAGLTTDDGQYLAVVSYQLRTVYKDTDHSQGTVEKIVPVTITMYSINKSTVDGKEVITLNKTRDPGSKAGDDEQVLNSHKEINNFVNVCDTTSLKIVNTVEGTGKDKDQDFNYTIDIPVGGKNIDLEDGAEIPYTKYDQSGNGTPGTFTVGDDNTFTLKDGEYILIENLPVGMIFEIEEVKSDDDGTSKYSTDTTYVSADKDKSVGPTFNIEKAGSERTVIGEAEAKKATYWLVDSYNGGVNTATFYNKYDVPVNSGISVDMLPYVLVMIAALCGTGLLVSKKRLSR
jgi:hypothetical protein